MPTFANIEPSAVLDGAPYCSSKTMPAAEGDLFNETAPPFVDPAPVVWGQALLAVVVLTSSGGPESNTSYVILQTDLGDGQWVDVAGVLWTGTQGQAVFTISAGVAGAAVVQQTRSIGTAPGANFANQITLGGRIRFVGKSTLASPNASSSSHSGALAVTADIRFKLLGLR